MPPIDPAAIRAWIQVPASLLSDEMLDQVIEAEQLIQSELCRIPADPPGELPADLLQGLYRRVAREVAARGIPLGLLGGDSEFGPARLSRWDSEIERLEGPRRRVIFA